MRNTIIMLALFCNVLLAHAEEIDSVNAVNPNPVVRDDQSVSPPPIPVRLSPGCSPLSP